MKVLQLIDSLHAGGAERVAVNYANELAGEIDKSFICSTREEGVLIHNIDDNVKYMFLGKTKTIDVKAIIKLNKYVKSNNIDIIHAHSSSFFLATLIKLINHKIKIVWHDHFGDRPNSSVIDRTLLRVCSFSFSMVIVVNKNLENWANKHLNCKDIFYLQNFPTLNDSIKETTLKGIDNKRIISLANLRPEKDHLTLLEAFNEVVKQFPDWTLHFVGKDNIDSYSKFIKQKIKALYLERNVFLYNSKSDISHILHQCQIGVLSSKSEGLPLALLEYGLAKLSVIVTKVGECENVVGTSENGILIDAENIEQLKDAILFFINNEDKRNFKANNFNKKVVTQYSSQAVINKLIGKYKIVSLE